MFITNKQLGVGRQEWAFREAKIISYSIEYSLIRFDNVLKEILKVKIVRG